MASFGQVVGGYGFATGIGVLLVISLVASIAVRSLHRHRRTHSGGAVSTAATPAAQQRGTPASAAQSNHRGTPQQPEASTGRPFRNDRNALLIEEGLVVRERLAGDIDAAAYQSRMHDLASRGRT